MDLFSFQRSFSSQLSVSFGKLAPRNRASRFSIQIHSPASDQYYAMATTQVVLLNLEIRPTILKDVIRFASYKYLIVKPSSTISLSSIAYTNERLRQQGDSSEHRGFRPQFSAAYFPSTPSPPSGCVGCPFPYNRSK